MRLDEAVAYVIDVEFVWGYQATIAGLTKTPPPYTYPPPTTFLGALAEAIARSEGLGESSLTSIMNCLTEDLIAVTLKPINCIPIKYQDVNRIITLKKSGNIKYPSPKDLQGSFDAPARGRTILVSLDGNSPKVRWVLVWRKKPNCLDTKHFWRIHRIGSKESLASVINVMKGHAKPLASDVVRYTTYSFPLEAVFKYKPMSGCWVVEAYANPFKPFDKNESPALRYFKGDVLYFALPVLASALDKPLAWIRPSSEGVLYEVDDEEEGVIVGVRRT